MLSRYAVASAWKRSFSSPTPPPFTATYLFSRPSARLLFTSSLLRRTYTTSKSFNTSSPMEQNGAHSKRKQPPTPSNERPMKQIKAETDAHSRNGVAASPTPEMDVDDARSDVSLEAIPIVPVAGAVHDTAEWQKTIEGVVKSVVSIHFCQTCSFDTDPAIASEATGFVVDAEKGYIMTNRVCCVKRNPSTLLTTQARRWRRTIYWLLHLRQSRRVRCLPRIPRSRPRLWHPALRPLQDQVHAPHRAAIAPRPRQGRCRNSRCR